MATLTHHGGRVDQAALLFPDAPQPWIDLSTGINPRPWRPAEPLSFDLGRLPTFRELAGLEEAAADAFGASPETVVAVPGTEIALRLLHRLDLPPPYRHVVPGYRTHAEAFAGGRPITLAEVERNPGTLLFANPGNPTGDVLPADHIRALDGPGWLVVDEAFADAVPGASIAADLPPRTIVLRSFGKFFGLAGVRLGFVIAPPAIVAAVRRALGDWPVSTPAIHYGTAAYRDTRWIAATRAALAEHAARLDAVLLRHGLHPRGDCPLFRLVDPHEPLFDRLARAGILTRPFDDHPCRLRFGLPADASALARLDRALAHG